MPYIEATTPVPLPGTAMRTSHRQHRSHYRRILGWSLAVAVAAHIAIFALSPDFEVEPLDGSRSEVVAAEANQRTPSTALEVLFGPPVITTADGSALREPPDRILRAARVTELPMLCLHLATDLRVPQSGAIRLSVNSMGHAAVIEVAESTGNACVDTILANTADALRYHWLPDDRFPAPVQLVQPVTLVELTS